MCHPDIVGDGANDLAALLNLAYDILSDPNSRAVYDNELREHRKSALSSTSATEPRIILS